MPQFIENDPAELATYITSLGNGLIVFDGRRSTQHRSSSTHTATCRMASGTCSTCSA
jgi:hypothetical protein